MGGKGANRGRKRRAKNKRAWGRKSGKEKIRWLRARQRRKGMG